MRRYPPRSNGAATSGVSLTGGGEVTAAKSTNGEPGSGVYSVDLAGESSGAKVEKLLAGFWLDSGRKAWWRSTGSIPRTSSGGLLDRKRFRSRPCASLEKTDVCHALSFSHDEFSRISCLASRTIVSIIYQALLAQVVFLFWIYPAFIEKAYIHLSTLRKAHLTHSLNILASKKIMLTRQCTEWNNELIRDKCVHTYRHMQRSKFSF